MPTPADWAREFARQAQADFRLWQSSAVEDARPCHRMMFLQMACEKLCKARLIDEGSAPDHVQTSHGYIANPLPVVIRNQLEHMGQKLPAQAGLLQFVRRLAAEIEVANPAVDRNGQRPDNCEYPWEDAGGVVRSPLDWTFTPDELLRDRRYGVKFVKLLKLAIDRAVAEV